MTTLPWLESDHIWFPPAEQALRDPDGLLAVGGDLSTERLVHAYREGIFPWFSDDQPILWWSPDPRCVIFPRNIHISRSLRRTLNSQRFHIDFNRDFPSVIQLCANSRLEGTWITPEMMDSYIRLHEQGYAHSIECRNQRGDLVGGMYGVALGRCFFGESMFSLETNASKVVMVYLAKQLEEWGFALIDCQVESPHLISMGATPIPRSEFLSILRENVHLAPNHTAWKMEWQWSGGST